MLSGHSAISFIMYTYLVRLPLLERLITPYDMRLGHLSCASESLDLHHHYISATVLSSIVPNIVSGHPVLSVFRHISLSVPGCITSVGRFTEFSVISLPQISSLFRVQRTVDFPIGGHVNVLHDYKKM